MHHGLRRRHALLGRARVVCGVRDHVHGHRVRYGLRRYEHRPGQLRCVRPCVPRRGDVPGRSVHVHGGGLANVRRLRRADAHLPAGGLVGVVGLHRTGRVQGSHHAIMRRNRLTDVQQRVRVGRLHLRRGRNALRPRLRQHEHRPGQLRRVRGQVQRRVDLRVRRVRLFRAGVADVRQLRDADAHVHGRHMVGLVGVHGTRRVRREHDPELRRRLRNANLQRDMPVGGLRERPSRPPGDQPKHPDGPRRRRDERLLDQHRHERQ